MEEETPSRADWNKLIRKYEDKISEQMGSPVEGPAHAVYSREYLQFKDSYLSKRMTYYENFCNFAEKTLKFKPDSKMIEPLEEYIKICHLNITPTGVMSSAVLAGLILIFGGGILGFILGILLLNGSYFLLITAIICGMIIVPVFMKIPEIMANSWRMKTSNQMVVSVFYVVTYMRHTSNLELAINFASNHISPPLALDFKKVLWDVETGKYDTVKDSLDAYLTTWKKWNAEFVESIHLIEGSLYESNEEKRLDMLNKALEVILEETYEKMLGYARDLKSPITMLHMLGVILPILGLVILPLVVSFMSTPWIIIATLYNIILPIIVYIMGTNILSKRPTGYGASDISETNPEFKKYEKVNIKIGKSKISLDPLTIAIIFFTVFFLIGISPVILHYAGVKDIGLDPQEDETKHNFWLLEYKISNDEKTKGQLVGPYGFGAAILSICIPLSVGVGLGLYYRLRSRNVIKIRENTQQLEAEFASALFQLGNRVGDGLPPEIALSKVSNTMTNSVSAKFFQTVTSNISLLGMGLESAIFDKKVGALVYFPSNVIESTMKVFIQSVRKGPKIAAHAIISVAQYIKEIHRVNERLKDLLGEIISSMQSQINFMAPVIAGIVIGITSMITTILGKLRTIMDSQVNGSSGNVAGVPGGLISGFGDGIPTYYFQIVVGLYVVQIVFILTILSNGIENGADKLAERYQLGQNLIKSTIIYCVVALLVMLLFNIVASSILNSIGSQ